MGLDCAADTSEILLCAAPRPLLLLLLPLILNPPHHIDDVSKLYRASCQFNASIRWKSVPESSPSIIQFLKLYVQLSNLRVAAVGIVSLTWQSITTFAAYSAILKGSKCLRSSANSSFS